MKLTIFGATGRTGMHLVQQALSEGHDVTAFVRSPEKLTVQHKNLVVVQGDVFNAEQVAAAVAGADTVISGLGPVRGGVKDVMAVSAQNIVAGMQQHGVRRLIWSTGAGVPDANDRPTFVNKLIGFILKLVSGSVLEDSLRSAEIVKQSGLDWTVVRGPMLTDGEHTASYRASYVGPEMNRTLARPNFADFMLKQIHDSSWLHKMPAVSDRA